MKYETKAKAKATNSNIVLQCLWSPIIVKKNFNYLLPAWYWLPYEWTMIDFQCFLSSILLLFSLALDFFSFLSGSLTLFVSFWLSLALFSSFCLLLSLSGSFWLFLYLSFSLKLSQALSSFLKPGLSFFGSPGFYLSLWLYWTVALFIHSDSHGDGVPIFSYSFLKMNEKKSNHKYKALTHPIWWIYAVAESKIDWCLEAAMSLFIYCMHKSLEASWSFDTPIFVPFFLFRTRRTFTMCQITYKLILLFDESCDISNSHNLLQFSCAWNNNKQNATTKHFRMFN